MCPAPRPDDSSDSLIGKSVGKYRVLTRAGQGGMGTVWKAEDPTLRRTVALKFLPEVLAGSPEARRRFAREARAAGGLSHPGIATVFETGEIGDRLYIAIQWIEGETVADLCAHGALEVRDAVRIARDAADALAHAHSHGVLHRDVSGRNVMVGRDGRVTVLDFGLVLPEGTSRITSNSSTLGTMAYLAPEVILGGSSTQQSDVYGLGAVFYEMLTGTVPFRGERPEAILYAAVNEPLESPVQRQPGIPAGVEAVALSALARDPATRYASAAAFAAALEALQSGETKIPPTGIAHGPVRQTTPRVATPPRTPLGPAADEPAPRYVAVVPFRDLQVGTGNGHGEHFSLGVTETVRAQLSRYPGIFVVSGGGLGPTEGGTEDLRSVARMLGADVVLHGSLQRMKDRLRITFALFDPLQGVQIAGDVIDGVTGDIFLLQDQIARKVAGILRPGGAAVTGMPERTGLQAVSAQERYLKALGYLQRSDDEALVDGAITLLTGLRDGGSDSASVEAALGRAYLHKYQHSREREWETNAENACRRALELDPRSVDVMITLGNVQRVSGHFTEAARSFREALKMRRDDPEALVGLARALEASDKLAKAEETYLRVMALRPNYWETYQQLGAFYFRHGQYDRAAQLWGRVVDLTPDNARAYYNLGGAYFRMERFEEAIEAFNRSIAIRPEANAFSNLGTVHYFLGHSAEAAAMFERAVALRPLASRLWGNLGDAYRWIAGREGEAASAFVRAIELMHGELEVNPNNAEGLGWLAEWLARRGDTEEAIRTVRRALKLAPHDVNGMARAVNVFHLAGDRAEALHWLEAAVSSGYGLAEFERDPDLKPLREDPAYARLVAKFMAA